MSDDLHGYEAERFWAKVDKSGECWLWTAGKIRGYGVFKSNYKMFYAHRLSYQLVHGPIPKELHLDHLCRVPACLNPAHLEAVPPRVNILRGIGPSARNAVKVKCEKGHPFDAVNTYVFRGFRACRICRNVATLKYRHRKAAG